MKRSKLRESGLRPGPPMYYIDHDKEHITFRGKFPSVMAIPNIMKTWPDYTHEIITWRRFNDQHNIEGA